MSGPDFVGTVNQEPVVESALGLSSVTALARVADGDEVHFRKWWGQLSVAAVFCASVRGMFRGDFTVVHRLFGALVIVVGSELSGVERAKA